MIRIRGKLRESGLYQQIGRALDTLPGIAQPPRDLRHGFAAAGSRAQNLPLRLRPSRGLGNPLANPPESPGELIHVGHNQRHKFFSAIPFY